MTLCLQAPNNSQLTTKLAATSEKLTLLARLMERAFLELKKGRLNMALSSTIVLSDIVSDNAGTKSCVRRI